jgi:hypothetical protein
MREVLIEVVALDADLLLEQGRQHDRGGTGLLQPEQVVHALRER